MNTVAIILFVLLLVGVSLANYFISRELDREYYRELEKIKQKLDDVIKNANECLSSSEKQLAKHKKEMRKLNKKQKNEN